MATAQDRIRSLWRRLGGASAGRVVFSRLLGRLVPYTGSIRPRVHRLEPGLAVVSMRDRRAVRNHLRSIHAIALANLAEVASGLALNYALPDGLRAILVGLDVEYLKKARGRIVAEGRSEVPSEAGGEDREVIVTVELNDEAGDAVARGRARWRVGPAPEVPPADR